MKNNYKKGYVIPLVIAIVVLVLGGSYVYYKTQSNKAKSNLPADLTDTTIVATSTSNTEPTPVITSISQSSGSIGTVIELKGTNLAGFEGDLDAIIENSKGETAYLPGIGSVPRTDQTIRVKIDSQLCKSNNSYSGLPCTSYLTITPGTYKIYTAPWGKMSNKMQFMVTDSVSSLKTYSNPEYGFSITYPIDGKINDTDSTGGRSLFLTYGGSPLIEIDVQSKMYGNQGSNLVPAECVDRNDYAPSITEMINGINFIKTDVSGDYGGMQSAAVAQSYCVVHNGIRYRLVPRIQYSRYTNERGDGVTPSVPTTPPDKAASFQKFNQVINSLNFKFTN